MLFITQIFTLLLQLWDTLLDGVVTFVPWLRTTFPLASWFQGILEWLNNFKLPV